MCALIGGWRLADFNPLDLFGADLIQRKPGWCPIAIEQDNGVVRPKAAHPWRIPLKRDPRQTLEHIGNVGVAELIQFLAAVYLLGDLRTPAQLGIVSLTALDDDAI